MPDVCRGGFMRDEGARYDPEMADRVFAGSHCAVSPNHGLSTLHTAGDYLPGN
jgi:hypothetical protein